MESTESTAEVGAPAESFSRFVGDGLLVDLEIRCRPDAWAQLDLEVWDGRSVPIRRVVRFDGLAAFDFRFGAPSTVLFDIEALRVADFIEKFEERLKSGWRHRWPVPLDAGQELGAVLEEKRLTPFELTSSAGLDGWFLATRMSISLVREGGGLELEAQWPLHVSVVGCP